MSSVSNESVQAHDHAETYAELKRPPSGPPPDPPVETAGQELPFENLTWENFEKLCHRLAVMEGEPEDVQRYGVQGDEQAGIDIFRRTSRSAYAVYQCKKYKTLHPSIIRNAVTAFLDGSWASRADQFVFCTSHSLSPKKLADEICVQVERLLEHDPPIKLKRWGADELSLKLKGHPELVEEFFGEPWLKRFLPSYVVDRTRDSLSGQLAEIKGTLLAQVRVLNTDWAPEAQAQALKALPPSELLQLYEEVGEPPVVDRLVKAILTPPSWMNDADDLLWTAVARIAEGFGEWAAAASAWELAADRQSDDYQVTGCLISAAVSWGIAQNDGEYERCVARAREVEPDHPRLRMEDIPQSDPAREQLEALKDLHSDDPLDSALIACRRAMASMLLPDLDLATEHLRAAQLDGGSLVCTQMTEICLAVQSARLDHVAARTQDGQRLRLAQQQCLKLRLRLLEERRYVESGRLLMLAADAALLQEDRRRARHLLDQAVGFERRLEDAAISLALVALRGLEFVRALRFLELIPDSPEVELIRATALAELGDPAEQANAVRTLDERLEQAPNALAANEVAFFRLSISMSRAHAPWSERAEQTLRNNDHEREAVIAKAYWRAKTHADYDGAEELLNEHPDLWARATQLHLAMVRGQYTAMRRAANGVLAMGPSQSLRVEAGQALFRCGDLDRSLENLRQVTYDRSAPAAARADACELAVRIAACRDDWALADTIHRDWIDALPSDTRANVWAPRIARNLSTQRE